MTGSIAALVARRSRRALRGPAAVVRLLARKGTDGERARCRYWEFPARLRKSAGPVEIIDTRMEFGADMDMVSLPYRFTPLMPAATGGHETIVVAPADCRRGHPRRDCRGAAQRLDLGAGRRTPGDRRAADSRWCAAAHPATRADYSRLAGDRHRPTNLARTAFCVDSSC